MSSYACQEKVTFSEANYPTVAYGHQTGYRFASVLTEYVLLLILTAYLALDAWVHSAMDPFDG